MESKAGSPQQRRNTAAVASGGLSADTSIYTAEFGPRKISSLIDQKITVLAWSPGYGRIMAFSAVVRSSGTKRLLRVITDKGEFVVANDQVMFLADGRSVEARAIQREWRLHAHLLWKRGDGYIRVTATRDGRQSKRELLHRVIARDILGADIKGRVVHHLDGDPMNNGPGNLEVTTQSKHAMHHGRKAVIEGTHVFLTQATDPRFDLSGERNGMHRDAAFWKSEKAGEYRDKKRLEMQDRNPRKLQRSAVRTGHLNRGWMLINSGHDISTEEKYFEAEAKHLGRVHNQNRARKEIAFQELFGGYEGFLKEMSQYNHRVRGVEEIGTGQVFELVILGNVSSHAPSAPYGPNVLIWSGSNRSGSGPLVACAADEAADFAPLPDRIQRGRGVSYAGDRPPQGPGTRPPLPGVEA